MKRVLWTAIKWLIGPVLVVGMVWWNWEGFRAIASEWDKFEPSQLLISGLLFFVGSFLTFLRWHLLVRAQDLPFRLSDAIRLGYVGIFFSSFLPGSVTGDLVKAGFLAREQARRTVAITTIVVDRFLGLYGLLLVGSVVGIVYWDQANAVVDEHGRTPLRTIVLFTWGATAAGFVGVAALGLLALWGGSWRIRVATLPKVGRLLGELMSAEEAYRSKIGAVMLATLVAMVGHVLFVLCYYFAARAVPPPIPTVQEHALLVPVGMVAEAVPLTPGGLGVGEAIYEYLYHLVDASGEYKGKGILLKLGQRLITWIVALIGLAFYLPLRTTVRQLIKEDETHVGEENVS